LRVRIELSLQKLDEARAKLPGEVEAPPCWEAEAPQMLPQVSLHEPIVVERLKQRTVVAQCVLAVDV